MIHHGVPLDESDKAKLERTLKKFEKENKKRWVGLFFFFVIGSLIILFAGWGKPDFMIDAFIMLGVFAIFGVIAFKFIIKMLKGKFSLDLQQNTKTVYEGEVTGKHVNVFNSEMKDYEIDKQAKLIKATTIKKSDGAKTIHRWRCDKDDSSKYLKLKNKVELIIDGDVVAVDLAHFAHFDVGEKVKVEKFTNSKQLIRVSSIDDPEKVIETQTIKFK